MLINTIIELGNNIANDLYSYFEKRDRKKSIKETEKCDEQMHEMRLTIHNHCSVCDSGKPFNEVCPNCSEDENRKAMNTNFCDYCGFSWKIK